ncbi:MAG: efflux RND transporter permease subunit [Candidatus Competibacteraceae bacterium]|nr:efflux RND transporter permease subunit [Candidatus Competibacteraceae bacterium]MCB1806930.1 efflux RND transporter permease subunit [Candidatus Competibacteraceae bacterium]
MNLTRFAVENKTLTNFIVFLLVFGGFISYFELGRLEDPDFTVKTAIIITQYPGASPLEVEQEVTDRIEVALQEMTQLKELYSFSRAGLSIIKVDMQGEYWADRLPQVWDEMRKKIRDVMPLLPPGARKPEIVDDFSFVYGFVLAVTGDGYSYAELEDYAKDMRKELSLVKGVSRVELWGTQPKVIYLDVAEAQLAAFGLTTEDILATLALQNMVVSAGSIEVPGRRLRIEASGEFQTPEDIGDLVIRRSILDTVVTGLQELAPRSRALEDVLPLGATGSGSRGATLAGETVRLKDVVTIRQGYLEPPISQMRYQGQSALAIQLANQAGGNILATGKVVDERLEELLAELPAGIEVSKFVWQSDLVEESIDGFIINLVEAVLIVLVVLAIAMGWRMGVVIGWALLVTILGTFVFMQSLDIALQRVSLGALVVALGMMVDNAIVVADNYSVRLGRGMKPLDAAIESAAKPGIALLGATVVAIMAFYPVYAATSDGGEYGRSMFVVVAISLLLSWVLAMTMTPLNCMALIKPPKGDTGADPYGGGLFRAYRWLLEGAIRWRMFTILSLTVVLIASAISFINDVPRQFFPNSTRTQFMIDYWAPQGTPIQSVSADLKEIEMKLEGDSRVKNIGTFIGMGGPRFYLPVNPEFPYPEFGQLIVNTPTFDDVKSLVAELEPWLNENYPQALTRVRKYTVGPGDTWPFELRISGPADADLNTLRQLGEQGMAILKESGFAKHVRTDMRQREQKVVIDYDQDRGRWSAVSRANIAEATRRAYDGMPVGLYRDGDDLLPIIARNIDQERQRAAAELDVLQVKPTLSMKTTPLGQVTEDIRLEWEDPIITRFDRRRQVAIQAAPDGVTFPALRASVIEQIEAIKLPPGYNMSWDGEYASTLEAQLSLVPGMVPGMVIMTLIIVALFNSLRPPIIMALTVPFALIGITAILLPTQTPFGFMALIGAMSLVGLMIKNSIVLLDEINANQSSGMKPYDATVAAGLSRVRPVALGAATTVLGVVPLLQDAFWISMAMTIMAGLAFGTLLTMVLVPTFYATLYRIKSPKRG